MLKMNRKEYIEFLETQSGTCDCLKIRQVYEEQEKASRLEEQCDSLAESVDLENTTPEDLPLLREYAEKTERFDEQVTRYNVAVSREIKEGNLNLFSHNLEDSTKKRITSLGLKKRVAGGEIVTINCYFCDQQVDFYS